MQVRNCDTALGPDRPGWPQIGPLWYVNVEVHLGTTPPHKEKILTSPPGGLRPHVGQDVFVSTSYGGRDRTAYSIDWNRPPQYGADQASLSDPDFTEKASETEHGTDPVQQLHRLKGELSAGRITREEYLQAWQAIMRSDG